MAIDNYLELTSYLIQNYIGLLYPTEGQFQQKLITKTDKLIQHNLVNEEQQVLLVLNVCELTSKRILINLVNSRQKVESLLIDWGLKDIVDNEIEFPVQEINLSNDLISAFNSKIRLHLYGAEESNTFFGQTLQANVPPPGAEEREENRDKEKLRREISQGVASAPTLSTSRPSDMPDFEDEYEIKKLPTAHPPAAFPAIGDRDLNPPGLPKHPQLKPFIDPLNPDDDGGMYPSPQHPIFGGRSQGGNTSRLGVPPGARYDDPYGEDKLDLLGSGLPGNLRHTEGNGGFPGSSGNNRPFGI